ncbi:MAG: DUF4013 domain-containing protein [Pyrinomonadaceae bacterium]
MSAKNDVWQVMVNGQVYESDYDGLIEWVAEGSFLLTDKVKKGNLNWIEAGKVPVLRRLFLGDAAPATVGSAPSGVVGTSQSGNNGVVTAPVAAATPYAMPPVSDMSVFDRNTSFGPAETFTPPTAAPFVPAAFDPAPTPAPRAAAPAAREFVAPMPPVPAAYRPVAACYNHPQVAPKYMCKNCANTFCYDCVKFINGGIPICYLCGELCDLFEKVQQRAVREHIRKSGFGFEDFGAALAYPFKHPVSLVAGAAIYGLLLIAGLFGNIVAYMLLFGCMTQAIQQVAWGRLDRCFMPEDDFSFYDDLVRPAFLGIGITIVTWGPTLVLAIILVWNIMATVRDSNDAAMKGARTESSQVTAEDFQDLGSNDPVRSERAARKIEASQQAGNSRSPSAASQQQAQQMFMKVLAFSLPILALMCVTVLWGFFYYPMALTVAGYTQEFRSVLNPLVGLDTIKRMGFTYVKAFLMYLAVGLVGAVITVFVWIITSPFDMPLIGNLPGKVINGVVTFYTSLVIACLLGLSLYKSSDKLDIATD